MKLSLLHCSKRRGRIFAALCLLIMSCIVASYSDIWVWGDRGRDSNVFTTVAMQMQNGLMPYRDSFDHKGPLIYIYNFIGNSISLEWGIIVVEFFSAFAFLLAFYKIARIYCGVISSLLAVMLCMASTIAYFDGGNFTEEYALPFIAWGLWVFIEYFQLGKVSKRRLALCGFCFGAVCLLRANMAAVWVVFCVVVLVKCLWEKQYKEIGHFLVWFMAGFALIALPIVLWLALNGALKDFWADYILFNKQYIARFEPSLVNKCRAFAHFAIGNCMAVPIIILAYLFVIEKETFSAIYLIYAIATVVSICLSGKTYDHYGMILSPVFIYPVARVLPSLICRARQVNKDVCLFVLILIVLFGGNWQMPFISAARCIKHCIVRDISDSNTSEDAIISRYIRKHTDEGERIIVYGNRNAIYVLSHRLPACKYSYQSPIGDVCPEIMDAFYDELCKNVPKVFVAVKNNVDKQSAEDAKRLDDYLFRHGYQKVSALSDLKLFDVYTTF